MTSTFSVKIVYSFCYLPSRRVENDQQGIKYTGIKQKRYGSPCDAASDLAYRAFLPVMSSTESLYIKEKLETLIFASTSPDVPSPATACFLHKKLGFKEDMHCFDVVSSCSSFLSALRIGAALVEKNKYCAVVASELKHKSIDQNDLRSLSLFSDGSGGVILEKDENESFAIEHYFQRTLSEYSDHIIVPVGGSREPISAENLKRNTLQFKHPKKIFIVTVENILNAVTQSIDALKSNENYVFFIHQANKNILEEVKSRLPERIARRIPILMSDVGNMLSASIPVLRCRVYFLRALYFVQKTLFSSNNIIHLFLDACEKTGIFKYQTYNNGIEFCFSFNHETFFIFDDGADSLETSWLADLDIEELRNLNSIFAEDVKSKHKNFKDIFIAAGGGFMTIGASYKYIIY